MMSLVVIFIIFDRDIGSAAALVIVCGVVAPGLAASAGGGIALTCAWPSADIFPAGGAAGVAAASIATIGKISIAPHPIGRDGSTAC